MSTDPTLMAAPGAVIDPTAATDAALDIESIKEIMDAFDPASLLPELDSVFGLVVTVCRVAVMVGPLILLGLGIAYLLLAPKEANYYFGYRCYYGMGSVEAWRFTQRLAGIVLGVLGLVLTLVMFFVGSGYAGMEAMAVVWSAVKCLGWQAGLALVANVAISLTAMARFDRRGEYRIKK